MTFTLSLIFLLFFQIPEKLALCPDSPNCVNSYQRTEGFEPMQALDYDGSVDSAFEKLERMINDAPRTEIVIREGNYIKAIFTIAVFGFKDDVEFLADEENKVIHFRSASRTGYYDFGVNKNRMKKLQEKWEEMR